MWFDRYNRKQKIILIGVALLILGVIILGLSETPSFVMLLFFLVIAACCATLGIIRIVNIVRTPAEEKPAPVPESDVKIIRTEDEHQTIVVVQQPQAVEKKVKGRVWGTLGMLYMAGYVLYIQYVLDGTNVTNLGEAIGKAAAYRIVEPFFYCVLASALLSLIGVIGKNKTCILLALAATIGAVFILPGAFKMLLIPAVLFLISYIRMAK